MFSALQATRDTYSSLGLSPVITHLSARSKRCGEQIKTAPSLSLSVWTATRESLNEFLDCVPRPV
jgi:hypothetical protein